MTFIFAVVGCCKRDTSLRVQQTDASMGFFAREKRHPASEKDLSLAQRESRVEVVATTLAT